MIQAVIFDFDGLILDTETPEFESFQEVFTEHGAELTLAVWGAFIGSGPGEFNPYDHLEQCIGKPIEREQVRRLRREKYDSKMLGADIRPGVRDYLIKAKELGLRIGLASSSSRAWVTGYLDRYGLLSYFDCIRSSDDVEKVKPDPALYVQALEGLGVEPSAAIAFEDSPNGSLAAIRAGLHCVVVPNTVTALLTFGEHHLRLSSMEERGLDEVIQLLGSRMGSTLCGDA
jgi:HAD superfamily hydrolase (TIGR01509 family)